LSSNLRACIPGLACAVTAILFLFNSCRKGDDDPLLSLRSRKARVAGEWQLTSGFSESTAFADGSSASETYEYGSGSYSFHQSIISPGATISNSESGEYALKISFDRDGNFSMEETKGKNRVLYTGIWNFTKGVGEYKNK
jgi:hypothetical protein